jgi:penicillin G amidase
VPYLVAAARRVAARGTGPNARVLEEAARELARWDRRYTLTNTGAVLFDATMREVALQTWDELASPGRGLRLTPSSAVLSRLMTDSASTWWDVRDTPAVEDRDATLASALATAFLATRQRYGPPEKGGWVWSKVHHANVYHLLRIPALSALDLPVTGGPTTLSPISGAGTNGPSWRMVVDLGPTVHAWVTYPGGQSGNPASPRYRDRIPQWVNGQLEAVHVPATADELPAAQRSGSLTLQPKR